MKNLHTFEQHNNKLTKWELNDRIEKLVNAHMKEIPYEGTEVDVYGLREAILDLICELSPEYKDYNKIW